MAESGINAEVTAMTEDETRIAAIQARLHASEENADWSDVEWLLAALARLQAENSELYTLKAEVFDSPAKWMRWCDSKVMERCEQLEADVARLQAERETAARASPSPPPEPCNITAYMLDCPECRFYGPVPCPGCGRPVEAIDAKLLQPAEVQTVSFNDLPQHLELHESDVPQQPPQARSIEARLETARQAVIAKDGWLPTAANINALPEPVRSFIHQLETSVIDPAGDTAKRVLGEDTIRQLQAALVNEQLAHQETRGTVAAWRALKTWECGCGCVNGVDLTGCSLCLRPRSEGQRLDLVLAKGVTADHAYLRIQLQRVLDDDEDSDDDTLIDLVAELKREGETVSLDASLDTDVIVDTSSLARTVPVYPRTVVPVKAQPHPCVDDDSPALAGSGAPPQPPTWLCAECRQQWLACPSA